jgi:hypothetical protein
MQIALKKSIFQQIIDFIFDVNFITLGMLVVCSARAIETQTLYFHAYPQHLEGWPRYAASWFMALAFELTATIVTVNEKHDSSKSKTIVFAWASVIMTALFLLDVQYDAQFQKIKITITQIFLSCVSGYMVYVYAELFTQKAREKMVELKLEVELNSLQSKINHLHDELTIEKAKANNNQLQLAEAHLQLSCLQDNIDLLLFEKKELEESLENQKIKASRKKDKDLLRFSVVKQANN